MKKLLFIPLVALMSACSGTEPVYWFDSSAQADGTGSNIPYYPDKPGEADTPVTGDEGYAPEGYRLVWSDEFESTVKLYSNWEFESGGNWSNNEQQYYCDGGLFAPTGDRTAEITDGTLKITARRITPSAASDNRSFISARLSTKQNWQYGYIEMKAKLPVESGTWSAFWMLPDKSKYPSWVRDASMKGGEIDIMEYVPNDARNRVWFSAHSYSATSEAGRDSGYTDPSDGKKYAYSAGGYITDPGTQWHWFGVEWTHEYIKGYLDGAQYYFAPNPSPSYANPEANPDWGFDKAFYIKLNLAMGGDWGGAVPASFSSATYEIDYVRVYQK